MKQWSKQYATCLKCNRTKYPHAAKGLCRSCYAGKYSAANMRKQRQSEAFREKEKEYQREYYLRNLELNRKIRQLQTRLYYYKQKRKEIKASSVQP